MRSNEQLRSTEQGAARLQVGRVVGFSGLLRDQVSLCVLIVLNIYEEADIALLTTLINKDSHLEVGVEVVEEHLSRLEQHGVIRARRHVRVALFWRRPLKTPTYTITKNGKAVLARALDFPTTGQP